MLHKANRVLNAPRRSIAEKAAKAKKSQKQTKPKVVVIDAGHGAYNRGTEPLGPGSKTRKAKDSGGTQGCLTKGARMHVEPEACQVAEKRAS